MALPKIKNATQFRENLYETLKNVSDGEPHLITQKDADPVVLISQRQYQKVLEENELLKAIHEGMEDVRAGRVYSHEEMVQHLQKLTSKWK
jgi:PHD/YefM family antitoxin component YafN of YafNO toxin-antitoxin module